MAINAFLLVSADLRFGRGGEEEEDVSLFIPNLFIGEIAFNESCLNLQREMPQNCLGYFRYKLLYAKFALQIERNGIRNKINQSRGS